ncbi:DUF397 domain-containing protein [Streptomyces sp. QH1-20]|uniref:DUF397 domain-containing protein n=1 Tax=Streptomyces sp. QH1-20 TaxID=3240934 RepID=UPI0035135EAF
MASHRGVGALHRKGRGRDLSAEPARLESRYTSAHALHVRDSKHMDGPQLCVNAAPWAAFVVYASGH